MATRSRRGLMHILHLNSHLTMRCTCRPCHLPHVSCHGSCIPLHICFRTSRARYLAAFSLDVRYLLYELRRRLLLRSVEIHEQLSAARVRLLPLPSMSEDVRGTGACICFFSGERISLLERATGNLSFIRAWEQRVLFVVRNASRISRC